MKKLICSIAAFLLVCTATFSQNESFKATTRESDDSYDFSAVFSKDKNQEVLRYMDKVLGRDNDISFSNTQLDAKMTLNDKSTFYIRLSPGNLKMKFSKKENTASNYKKLKNLCQGLNEIVHEKS